MTKYRRNYLDYSMIDQLEFYKTATEMAASSLNPEEALPNLFKYIRTIMPLDVMAHIAYTADFEAVRIRSMRTVNFSVQPNHVIPLPPQIRKPFTGEGQSRVEKIDNLDTSKFGTLVSCFLNKKLKIQLGSAIFLKLFYEKQVVGISGFFAKGVHQYKTDHVKLIEMLFNIFNLMAHNAMRFYDQQAKIDCLDDEKRFLYKEIERIGGNKLIGDQTGLKEIFSTIDKLSRVDTPVLILGETGVGKELIADAIQKRTDRSEKPYIKINCGAMTDTLIDSELFGHEKGAFTGATSIQKGRFERAHEGTIFLDEIGELPLAAQVRLLRVIQNKEIERVGSKETIPVDIRIIAATHRDLSAMVKSGTFREDLFFRLNVFPITVPPLRQRIEDIPLLLAHFFEKIAIRMKLPQLPVLKDNALQPLFQHDWPGNIRELENIVERAIIINPTGAIEFDHLINSKSASEKDTKNIFETLYELNRAHIVRVLDFTNGRINGNKGAAKILDLHPNTLRSRMKKLHINKNIKPDPRSKNWKPS